MILEGMFWRLIFGSDFWMVGYRWVGGGFWGTITLQGTGLPAFGFAECRFHMARDLQVLRVLHDVVFLHQDLKGRLPMMQLLGPHGIAGDKRR